MRKLPPCKTYPHIDMIYDDTAKHSEQYEFYLSTATLVGEFLDRSIPSIKQGLKWFAIEVCKCKHPLDFDWKLPVLNYYWLAVVIHMVSLGYFGVELTGLGISFREAMDAIKTQEASQSKGVIRVM